MTNPRDAADETPAAEAGAAWYDAPDAVRLDPSFLRQVEEAAGESISACFQCVKCSGGCPLGFAMEIPPHKLVRMVQAGLKQEVLASSTIWLCASCETCGTRCPNGVNIAHLMDALQQIAVKEGVPPAEKSVSRFHESFIDVIRAKGRLHEMGLVARHKLRTGKLLQDVGLGLRMFTRGKLKLLAVRAGDRRWLNKILPK